MFISVPSVTNVPNVQRTHRLIGLLLVVLALSSAPQRLFGSERLTREKQLTAFRGMHCEMLGDAEDVAFAYSMRGLLGAYAAMLRSGSACGLGHMEFDSVEVVAHYDNNAPADVLRADRVRRSSYFIIDPQE